MITRLESLLGRSGFVQPTVRNAAGGAFNALFIAVITIGLSLQLLQAVTNTTEFQRDFQSYYFAGRAYRNGVSPYSPASLANQAGRNIDHAFVYPPIALPIVSALSFIGYSQAYFAFLLLKIGALIGLVIAWRRNFIDGSLLPFLAFAAIAFNAAIFIDLQVGNISIFEQLLLWTGLAYLLRKNVSAFLILILLASLFKLTLAAFLVLPMILDSSQHWKRVTAALIICGAIQLGSFSLSPVLGIEFLNSLSGLIERGAINPSALAAAADLIELSGLDQGVSYPISIALYVASSVLIIGISWKALRTRESKTSDRSGALKVLLFCVVYTLISPRMKTYSLILMIVPAYIAISNFGNRGGVSAGLFRSRNHFLIGTFAILSSVSLLAYGSNSALGTLLSYSPLLAAFAVWLIYMMQFRRLADMGSGANEPGVRAA